MGKKAPQAPDFGPLVQMYQQLGNRYADFAQQQIEMAGQRQAALQPYEQQLLEGQLAGQRFGLNQAIDQDRFYRDNYRPAEVEMANQAYAYNTGAEQDRMARLAGSDVEQALAVQRGSSMRALERMGVNPNSGRFMALMRGNELQGAAMRAGAETNARFAARDQGFQRLAAVAGMGRNNSLQGIQAASGAAGVGTSVMGSADRVAQGYTNQALSAMNGQGSTIGGMGNLQNAGYQNRLARYNSQNEMWGGIGQLAGMGAGLFFKDGGMVRGPGTGTSDDVPAINTDSGEPIRLSNGEYVLPAKTVRALGVDKLDRIVMKTNGKPPVHRQRALAR